MTARTRPTKQLSLSQKFARLRMRLKDPQWRRYGGTLLSGKILGVGMVLLLMVTTVKKKFGYDDSLDAFGVHGAGGTLGAILTGVFATNAVNNALRDSSGNPLPLGLVDGHAGQVLNQLIATAIAWGLAIVGTLIILKICDVLLGLRVTPEHEIEGLDLALHGEEGYIMEA